MANRECKGGKLKGVFRMIIQEAIKELLQTVGKLHKEYPKKKFTLDGRLVGDLGEILAEQEYELDLYDGQEKYHDGETSKGQRVQIKATMKKSLSFPVDHVPDYYLGIKIHPDGSISEIFNGPGEIAAEAVKNRVPTKTNLHSVAISALERLNEKVKAKDRIPRRV